VTGTQHGHTISAVEYGCIPDGVTDTTAAVQNMIAFAKTNPNGCRLLFAPGTYLLSQTLDFSGSTGMILEGMGNGESAGAQSSAKLLYTGAGASFINGQNSFGLTLRGLQLVYSNAGFTGNVVDARNVSGVDTAFLSVEKCYIGGTGGASGATGINLDKCNTSTISSTHLNSNAVGIIGKSANGSYSNQIQIAGNCQFVNQSVAHIKNPGQAWNIQGCTFEQLTGNNAGAIAHDAGVLAQALSIVGNWFGDIGVAGTGAQIAIGGSDAISIIGNMIGFQNASKGILVDGNNITGLTVIGNRFDGGTGTCWDFGATTGNTKVSDIANFKVGSGTYINNPPAGIFQA
jgi:hypothetical protein